MMSTKNSSGYGRSEEDNELKQKELPMSQREQRQIGKVPFSGLKALTFRQIEDRKRISLSNQADVSSLDEWYQTVRDKPVSQFSDKDFGIACRQELNLEFVVPHVLTRIKSEPLVGDMYDGELLVALAGLPGSFWVNNPAHTYALRALLDSIAVETCAIDAIAAIHNLRSAVA